jgi:hypothetical protein
MKKTMIFIFCVLMSLSFGYASINAGPSCTIGDQNCIVGETGPQLTLSKTDPAGEKNAHTYDGNDAIPMLSNTIGINDSVFGYVSHDDFVLLQRNLFNKKADYCSLLGEDYYEIDIDEKGKYLRFVDTSSFVFMHEKDYFDYENDVYYDYYGTGLHKAYEIHSICNKYTPVQSVTEFSPNYIYKWKQYSIIGSNGKVTYIPVKDLAHMYQKLSTYLSDNDKSQLYEIIAASDLGITKGQDLIRSAIKNHESKLYKIVESPILGRILIFMAILIQAELERSDTVSESWKVLNSIMDINEEYNENTLIRIEARFGTLEPVPSSDYVIHISLVNDVTNIYMKEDNTSFGSTAYGHVTRIGVTEANLLDAYLELMPNTPLLALSELIFES